MALAKHAVERQAFAVSKSAYKMEILDENAETYDDYRPAGFANIAVTLQGKAKIKLDKGLGALPLETQALAVLKKMKMDTPKYSRKVEELFGRSFGFEATGSLPKNDKPKLYCFNIYEAENDERASKLGYSGTWAIEQQAFYNHFDDCILAVQKECLNAAALAGVKGKQADLQEGLRSIRSWVNYRQDNPQAPAYNYQQHSFPEDIETYD